MDFLVIQYLLCNLLFGNKLRLRLNFFFERTLFSRFSGAKLLYNLFVTHFQVQQLIFYGLKSKQQTPVQNKKQHIFLGFWYIFYFYSFQFKCRRQAFFLFCCLSIFLSVCPVVIVFVCHARISIVNNFTSMDILPLICYILSYL